MENNELAQEKLKEISGHFDRTSRIEKFLFAFFGIIV